MQASSLLRATPTYNTRRKRLKLTRPSKKKYFWRKVSTDTPYVILVTLKASLLCRLREAWLSYFMINAFNLHRLRGERMEKKITF